MPSKITLRKRTKSFEDRNTEMVRYRNTIPKMNYT